MAGTDAIEVEGTVRDRLDNGLYQVELANGHRVLAHLSRSMRAAGAQFTAGQTVILKMSFYDLSRGAICAPAKEI